MKDYQHLKCEGLCVLTEKLVMISLSDSISISANNKIRGEKQSHEMQYDVPSHVGKSKFLCFSMCLFCNHDGAKIFLHIAVLLSPPTYSRLLYF